jgi:hypothetical protein
VYGAALRPGQREQKRAYSAALRPGQREQKRVYGAAPRPVSARAGKVSCGQALLPARGPCERRRRVGAALFPCVGASFCARTTLVFERKFWAGFDNAHFRPLMLNKPDEFVHSHGAANALSPALSF